MKRKITGLVLVLAMVITIFGVGPVGVSAATTWTVDDDGPADFSSIQDAIDAAVAGDTVQVAAGTYDENITLKDGVGVLGAGADVTTIGDDSSDRSYGTVVTAIDVGSGTKLDGFTITNGPDYYGGYGGGMYNYNSWAVVSNCAFSDNRADYGSGMYNYNSSPIVTNCTFSGNRVSAGGPGAGMYNYNSSPIVTNCTFSDNFAGSGSGMYNYNSSPIVTNCTFSDNTIDPYGPIARGGGMCNRSSSPIVTNCILWNNEDEIYNADSTPVVTYCDVQGGYSGEGNIDANPLFVDPAAGDFHLQTSSPCIDAGDNSAPSLPSTDFEDELRICDGDGDTVAVVDMGVDEYCVYTPPQFEEFSIDRVFISIDRQLGKGSIAIGAAFRLEEGATYDLSIDEVTVSIDGVNITIPAGSFRQLRRGEVYIYNSPGGVKPRIVMLLDFDQGELGLFVRDVDASPVNSCNGVDVILTIGAMSASENVRMQVERVRYQAGS